MTIPPSPGSGPDMERALRGERRGDYVARMFDRVAGRYDLMNRIMSLGQDQSWRRRLAALAGAGRGALVLDLATGTGDVGRAVLEREPSATVVGADFSLPMMRVGRRKVAAGEALHFVAADALALPFPSGAFDAVLHAFLMRNIADIPGGFAEQWRVLKPGGRLISLEIVGPSSRGARLLYRAFFERAVPWLGALLSGEPDAYRYLPRSVLLFPPPDEVSALLREAGFVRVHSERRMLGSIAIHRAEKPGESLLPLGVRPF